MWLPSKSNLYSLWYLLEGRYTGYVNSVCIHSVCKAENNELTLMRYIFITLCPVWQPKRGNSSVSRSLITITTAAQRTKDQVSCMWSVYS